MRKYAAVVAACLPMFSNKSISRICRPLSRIPSPITAMPYPAGNGFKSEQAVIPQDGSYSYKCSKPNEGYWHRLIPAMKRLPRHSTPVFVRFTVEPTVVLPVNVSHQLSEPWQPCCSSVVTQNYSCQPPLPTTAIGLICYNKLLSNRH